MAPRVYFLVLVLLCFVLAKLFVHIAIYWVFTTCQALIQPLELGTIIEKWKTETEDRSKVLTQGHVTSKCWVSTWTEATWQNIYILNPNTALPLRELNI